jgi:hypothetical protein
LNQWREVTEFERPRPGTERLLIAADGPLAGLTWLSNRPETFRFNRHAASTSAYGGLLPQLLHLIRNGVIVIT